MANHLLDIVLLDMVSFTSLSKEYSKDAEKPLYRAIIPLLQAYVNAGEFTIASKFRYAVSINLKFYLVYAVIAIVGLVYLIIGNGYTTR